MRKLIAIILIVTILLSASLYYFSFKSPKTEKVSDLFTDAYDEVIVGGFRLLTISDIPNAILTEYNAKKGTQTIYKKNDKSATILVLIYTSDVDSSDAFNKIKNIYIQKSNSVGQIISGNIVSDLFEEGNNIFTAFWRKNNKVFVMSVTGKDDVKEFFDNYTKLPD